jgi:ribose transport system substrate-binding protein
VRAGAEQAAKDFKVKITYEGPETEQMVDKQMDMLSAALAKKPAAIGFAATDSKAAIPLMKKAKEMKIPVVAFDSGVDSDVPVTTAATDSKASAALAADKVAAMIGSEGEVALIAHDQVSSTGKDRRDGFVNQIKAKYPKIKIVDIQYGGDQLKANDIFKTMVKAHPKVKAIFATNEGAAIGAGTAKKEVKSSVILVGYDSGKGQKDMIMDGTIAGSITQNPVGIGYKVVEYGLKAAKGEKVPARIDTGFYWYDKSNIADPKIAAVLYD